MSKKLSLMFVGYFRDLDKDDLPKNLVFIWSMLESQYQIRSCLYVNSFYIGESSNIHDRIVEHNRDKDWKDGLKEGSFYIMHMPSHRRTSVYWKRPLSFTITNRHIIQSM